MMYILINEQKLHIFTCVLFSFFTKVCHLQNNLVMDYVLNSIFFLLLVIFLYPPAGILSLIIFWTFQALLLVLLLVVKLFIAVSIFITLCTVVFYFNFFQYLLLWLDITQFFNPLWIDVRTTPSIVTFIIFDYVLH